jgi:cystathionine beta-lyase family protein involved in aluminum resistance
MLDPDLYGLTIKFINSIQTISPFKGMQSSKPSLLKQYFNHLIVVIATTVVKSSIKFLSSK